MWKYAVSNGVSGTPTFIVNGVVLDANPTKDEWIEILDDLRAPIKPFNPSERNRDNLPRDLLIQ